MYGFIFMLLAILFQNSNHNANGHNCKNHQQVTTMDDGSGDTGHVPPKPPTPPPPPGSNP